ncbi:MAG: diphthine--ammonia ligase [Candidatus Thermoplasmatota archaeon]|nr:diphthine--ammonia ligase [Candidatus Thermoplasmatota archaeon]
MKVAVLASSGKDSSYCSWWATMRGWDIQCIASVGIKSDDSMMFQTNGVAMAALQSTAMDVPWLPIISDGEEESEITDVEVAMNGNSDSASSFNEMWPENWVCPEDLVIHEGTLEIDALVIGALRSDYQKKRIDMMCERLGIISYSPLWHHDSISHMHSLVDHGFEVMFVSVSADGLGEEWLGRILDEEALSKLEILSEQYRFNIDGEGGEFETVVLSSPCMDRRIECSTESLWEGRRGVLAIRDARLASMR